MNNLTKLTIWIDADAAPRDAKDLVFRASKRLQVPVVLVANQSISLPDRSELISRVVVSDGANIADRHIVEQSRSGDIAITADIPLAAQLVSKQVFVIDPRGEEFDDRNMASRLAARDLMDAARGAGMELKGPRPYSSKDRSEFASALDRVLTKAMRRRESLLKQSQAAESP